MNINAYGGYYSSKDFYQQKADAKEHPDTASTIGNKEMEAVLKEKDPELLNQIKGKVSKVWNGDRGYIGFSAEFKRASEYVYEARKEMGVDFSQTNSISDKNEEKLSKKAQDFLKNLREKYGDYDFMIGNSTDDLKALSQAGTKEYSVIFSSAEIERMANDEKYAEEKMQGVAGAVKMAKRVAEEYGFGSDSGENGVINKIGVTVDDSGKMKLFADLEKTTSKQRERIEANREKRAEEKKAADKAKKKNPYEKNDKPSVKRARIEADTEEEFIDKLKNLDWSKIEDSHSGDRVNFTA